MLATPLLDDLALVTSLSLRAADWECVGLLGTKMAGV